MRGSTRIIVITIALLALIAVGFLFVRGPMAHIQIPGERITTVGPFILLNTITATWLTMIILIGLAWRATRRLELVPRGLQNFFEVVIEALLNLVETTAGRRHGRRFFPGVATIFLFVLVNNYTGLLPGYGTVGLVEVEEHGYPFQTVEAGPLKIAFITPGTTEPVSTHQAEEGHGAQTKAPLTGLLVPFLRSANTDVNTPLAIAVASAIFVEFWGISTLGLFGYGSKFFNFGRLLRLDLFNGIVDVFIGLVELASELVRLISFTFRLFGNIFAGEVMLAVICFIMPWVVAIPFFGIELFVGFVQALIFAMLTLVFGMTAVSHGAEGQPASEHGH